MATGDLEYMRNHRRVYRELGKAADRVCILCGEQARHWAQIHGTDGTVPRKHYQPMCVRCHHRYDGIVGLAGVANKGKKLSEERKQQMAEASKGRVKSPETREKIRQSKLGKPRSEETKRKISETRKARGLVPSGEIVEKAKAANKNRKHTAETKRKMSESAKRRWARQRGEQ